jgi:hypothetical protein
LYRVGGETDDIDIVTVDKPASAQKIVNLQK